MMEGEKTQSDQLLTQGLLGDESSCRKLAKQFHMKIHEDLREFHLPIHLYEKVPYSFIRKYIVLPVDEKDQEIVVAVCDPLNLNPLEELRHLLGKKIEAVYVPKDAILAAINDCYNRETGAASQFIQEMGKGKKENQEDAIYDLLEEQKTQAPIVKLLNLILTEAIQQGASDIHFEPEPSGMKVRYRIDGVLHSRHSPSQEFQTQLLTRLKVMSKMDIAEHRLPQDGRIKLRMGRREIDFRVSTVPVVSGERIVLRILDKGNVLLGLSQLGMPEKIYQDFLKLINLPEGIFLVTGPTGSGKTTTLYSAISHIHSPETNIMTIEDPVEYHLKGIAQIGVRPKIELDFAKGLRHILRQDPDIVMIGEIRDKETAEIAVQASLTGHLVFSTLHTNDAPSAIARLVDMGVEPYLLSSSLMGVLAQRLVRRICPKCKFSYTPTDKEIASIGLTKESLENGKIYKGKGCDACYRSGYSGRHGLYELMVVNHDIRKQIIESPDGVQLRKVAQEQGMLSLLSHGAFLVVKGITTISEILRASRGID